MVTMVVGTKKTQIMLNSTFTTDVRCTSMAFSMNSESQIPNQCGGQSIRRRALMALSAKEFSVVT